MTPLRSLRALVAPLALIAAGAAGCQVVSGLSGLHGVGGAGGGGGASSSARASSNASTTSPSVGSTGGGGGASSSGSSSAGGGCVTPPTATGCTTPACPGECTPGNDTCTVTCPSDDAGCGMSVASTSNTSTGSGDSPANCGLPDEHGYDCYFECDGTGSTSCAGQVIVCPADMPCVVKCDATGACEGATIECGGPPGGPNGMGPCTVNCGAGTCNNLTVHCGLGPCHVTCDGSGTVTVAKQGCDLSVSGC